MLKKIVIVIVGFLFFAQAYAGTITQDDIRRVAQDAEQGIAEAQYLLGEAYYYGLGGTEENFFKAVEWYTKAAEQGHPKAQNWLGVCYATGNGVRKDIFKAIEWWEKAAKQGVSAAQYFLGICYEEGEGVRRDIAKAKEWYGKACDNKFQMGCDAYARLY